MDTNAQSMSENLESLLSRCLSRSVTREEFSRLEMPLGMSEASAWRMANLIRRASSVKLPFGMAANGKWHPDWYAPSRQFQKLLDACTTASITNQDALDALRSPEGRHIKINLIATDCFAALRDTGCALTREALLGATLGLQTPSSDQERLARNLFQVTLDSAGNGLRFEAADDIALVYRRCIEGVRLPTAQPTTDRELSPDCLSVIDHVLRVTRELETLPGAIARMLAFLELRPLPFANAFVGRMAFGELLRAQGFTVLSYLPILEFLDSWQRGSSDRPGYQPAGHLSDAIQIIGESRDWTRFFEEVLAWLLDETGWLLRKLARMKLRRERLEALLERDTTYTSRQHDVLVEALVHDDTEFTFAELMDRYGIVYSTAHSDLIGLSDDGFLQARRQGKRLFFIAAHDIHKRVHVFLRSVDEEMYARYFDRQGKLVIADQKRTGHSVIGAEQTEASRDKEDIRQFLPTVEPQRRMALLRDFKHKTADSGRDPHSEEHVG